MERAVVLHADILGFKNIIRKADADDNDDMLHQLKGALEQGVGTVTQFQKFGLNAPIRYKIFSDNIYVSFPYDEGKAQSLSDAILACLAFVRSYTAVMMDHNIFIRGGIAMGKDYSDDTTIFSVALVNAYELEGKAEYPRILVADEIIEFTKSGQFQTPGPIFHAVANNSILKDKDGLYFINPTGLAEELEIEAGGLKGKELHQAFIKRYLKSAKENADKIQPGTEVNDKIIAKYNWLQQVMLWLYFDRNNQLSKVDRFTSLRFEKEA